MVGRRKLAGLAIALLCALAGPGKTQEQPIMSGHPDGERFLRAAAGDDVAGLERLLTAGVPIDLRDPQGRTALLIATTQDARGAAKLLIAAGADVNAMDRQEDSPFLYAGAEGRLAILRMTLAAGADLASVNRYGGTALIPAAHHSHVETVRELLTTEIDIDHVNKLGWTALLEAIILGDGGPVHSEIVRLLVAAGVDVNLADGEGSSPLAHARRRNYSVMIEILEAAGAKP